MREAQGHALLGSTVPCLRAVERGRSLLAAQASGPQSALGLNSVTDPSGLVLGWCLFDLGEPAQAAEVLTTEIDRMPTDARRSRSRFGVRLAMAQAACGDVDGAAVTAATALADAVMVDSMTIRVDVRRLARELTRWPRHAALRHLHPVVRDVLQTAT